MEILPFASLTILQIHFVLKSKHSQGGFRRTKKKKKNLTNNNAIRDIP